MFVSSHPAVWHEPVHPCVCIFVPVFACCSFFFLSLCEPTALRSSVECHAVFEVSGDLPAAIKWRKRSENSRAGGAVATDRNLPLIWRSQVFVTAQVSKDVRTGGVRVGGIDRRWWEGGARDGQKAEGCHLQRQAAAGCSWRVANGIYLVKLCWWDWWGWIASVSSLQRWDRVIERQISYNIRSIMFNNGLIFFDVSTFVSVDHLIVKCNSWKGFPFHGLLMLSIAWFILLHFLNIPPITSRCQGQYSRHLEGRHWKGALCNRTLVHQTDYRCRCCYILNMNTSSFHFTTPTFANYGNTSQVVLVNCSMVIRFLVMLQPRHWDCWLMVTRQLKQTGGWFWGASSFPHLLLLSDLVSIYLQRIEYMFILPQWGN